MHLEVSCGKPIEVLAVHKVLEDAAKPFLLQVDVNEYRVQPRQPCRGVGTAAAVG